MARGDEIGGKADFGQGSSSPELGRGSSNNGARSKISSGDELIGALGTSIPVSDNPKESSDKSPVDEMHEQMEKNFFELWEAAAQRYFPGQDVEQSIARILYHYASLLKIGVDTDQNYFYTDAKKIYREMDSNGLSFRESITFYKSDPFFSLAFFMSWSEPELMKLASSNMDFSRNGPIRGALLMLINNLDNPDFSFEESIQNFPVHIRETLLRNVNLVDDCNFDDDTRKNLKIALKVLLKNLNTDGVNFAEALTLLPDVQQDVLNKYLSWES